MDARTQLDPAFQLFKAQLVLITYIEEEALTRWMVQHHLQLKTGFAQSHRPDDEVCVWVREQYLKAQGIHLGGQP